MWRVSSAIRNGCLRRSDSRFADDTGSAPFSCSSIDKRCEQSSGSKYKSRTRTQTEHFVKPAVPRSNLDLTPKSESHFRNVALKHKKFRLYLMPFSGEEVRTRLVSCECEAS